VNVSETFLSLSPLDNLAGLLDTTSGVFAMVTANVAGLMRAGLGGGGLPTVVISAHPIPRVMLLSMPRLALNISVAAPSTAARWTVVNVTSSGELVPWSASTTNTVPWIRLVVTSPSNGWIGLSTPLLTPRTVGLQLYLSCDGTSVLSTQLSIPAPELPRFYAELVDVSLKYSQIVSVIVGGASSGSALGRVFATQSLVMCRVATAVGVGVADFELKVCDDNEEGISNVARSAITSNAVAVAIVGAALCLLSVAWKVLSSTRSVTLLEGAYRMCLPSSMLSVWVLVAPSTTAAWTFLLSDLSTSTCLTTDVFLALCGMMMSISPILALTALWFFWARPSATATLLCTFESPPQNIQRRYHSELLHQVAQHLQHALYRRWKWGKSVQKQKNNNGAAMNMCTNLAPIWVVLLEYRCVWYAALDVAILMSISVLSVVSGLGSQALCRSSSGISLILLIIQWIVVLTVRPLTTLFSLVHVSLTMALTILSVVAQLVFLFFSSLEPSGVWLIDASSICNLLAISVNAIRTCLDVHQLWSAAQRRIDEICASDRKQEVLALPIEDDEDGDDPQLREFLMMSASICREDRLPAPKLLETPQQSASVLASGDDGGASVFVPIERQFWDTSGAAIGTGRPEDLTDVLMSFQL
jgi:hypothetical protein